MPAQSCWVLHMLVAWAEGQGSSARVPCCKLLQQDKARMAATALSSFLFRAILHCKGWRHSRNSNASLSHNPIFLVVRHTSASRLHSFLSRQGTWSCNTSGFISVLFPQVSPFLGAQCEEGLCLPPDLTLVGNWDQT